MRACGVWSERLFIKVDTDRPQFFYTSNAASRQRLKPSFKINMIDGTSSGVSFSAGSYCFGRHPHNLLSCEQRQEQSTRDAAAKNVIEHKSRLSLMSYCPWHLISQLGQRAYNGLGGDQSGTKMVR